MAKQARLLGRGLLTYLPLTLQGMTQRLPISHLPRRHMWFLEPTGLHLLQVPESSRTPTLP